jgi:hypothetical protein
VEIKAFISVMGRLNEISKVAEKVFMSYFTKHIFRICGCSKVALPFAEKHPICMVFVMTIDCLKASFHSGFKICFRNKAN